MSRKVKKFVMYNNIIDYLIDSAETYPDKVAFKDAHKSITFHELKERSQSVASKIIAAFGEIKNQPIAVYMEKSVDMLCAFMGIAYSGNFYSPIDIKSPQTRVENILETLDPIAVIATKDKTPNFNNHCAIVWYEDAIEEKRYANLEKHRRQILDTDPLYVLFTSGSTGKSKGVTISHRGVIDYIEWLYNTFHFDSSTVFGNQAPFYFDNSILDIYSTLRNGSTMVIIPEHLFTFPVKVLEFINEHRINTIFRVPSALSGIANAKALEKIPLEYIQKVLFCGEVMPNKQLNEWRKHYPEALYANLYGPTEITDVCAYYIVNRTFSDDEPLPIGKACENMEILVLNDKNELVQGEEKGELCVRGCGVSMGYYRNDEKTSTVFVQNPLNSRYRDIIYRTGDIVKYNEYGELVYLTRKDFQIKHQGHRIELGEIEVAATSISGVNQSCAMYDDKNKRIVLFYTTGGEVSDKMLYQELKTKVPTYMLPTLIKKLDNFKLNLNGKIDRVSLKQDYFEK